MNEGFIKLVLTSVVSVYMSTDQFWRVSHNFYLFVLRSHLDAFLSWFQLHLGMGWPSYLCSNKSKVDVEQACQVT